MAGYSGTALPKKLGIKEQTHLALVNAPNGFENYLGPLPLGAEIVKRLAKPLDIILLFVTSERALARDFAKLSEKLATNGMIWIAWPKKSSGVATDLSFERVQRIGLDEGLVDVKICAIDDTWSGLKFVHRKKAQEHKKALLLLCLFALFVFLCGAISTGSEEIFVEITGDSFTKLLQTHTYNALHTSAA